MRLSRSSLVANTFGSEVRDASFDMSRRLRGCRHAWVDVSTSGNVAAHTLGVLRGAASPHFTATVLYGDQPIGMRRSSSFVMLALDKSTRSAMTPSRREKFWSLSWQRWRHLLWIPAGRCSSCQTLPSEVFCVLFESCFAASDSECLEANATTSALAGLWADAHRESSDNEQIYELPFGRVVVSCVVLSVFASCGKQTAASSR